MHRVQVQLTDEQERIVREVARLRGISISSLIREGVDLLLSPAQHANEERRKRGLELIGIFGERT